ncbi:MAG: hypothetical protein FIB01_04790, partial [Gemmatimonadetes bacterium]|nr:hypothetical protein [Gemmatimonadota bacterium]
MQRPARTLAVLASILLVAAILFSCGGDSSPSEPEDTVAPTVTLGSTATSPTKTSPIPMTATFSEAVTGFAVGDITVGNGTAGNFVAASAT